MTMPPVKRFSVHLMTALLTFGVGVALSAASRLPAHRRTPAPVLTRRADDEGQVEQSDITRRPVEFNAVRCPNKTCNRDTRVCFESSDGVLVTIIESDYKSHAEADEWYRLSLKNDVEHAAEISERKPILSAGGRRVGERAVVRHPSDMTSIEWVDGKNNGEIYSSSSRHAHEFERAFLSGKVKLHSYFDFNLPPPDNGK